MFKPFYVHFHREPGFVPNHYARGFTILVTPDRVDPATMCRVQVAFCSPKDQFNKKEGRETAKLHAEQLIQKRRLPQFVSEQADHVFPNWMLERDYQYLYKYLF